MQPLRYFSTLAMVTLLSCLFDQRSGRAAEKEKEAALTISPAGGMFASNVPVTITGSTGEVRYTLDGSIPVTNSPLYSAPLLLSNSCLLQASVIFAGRSTGVRATASFTLMESNLAEFNSSLPLLVVQTFGQAIPAETNTPALVRFIDAEAGRPARVNGPVSFEGPAAVKQRGYTSRRYPKRSLALELRDPFGNSSEASLLGLPKDSDWVLYAPYPDKSLIRDVLAYQVSNRMGRYASRTRFIEVFLNETTNRLSRGHYAGIYVLQEKVSRGEHRVNVQKLSPNDKTEPAITGGYLFKKDHLQEVMQDDVAPPAPANTAVPPRLGRAGFPTGPGGFPADPAGFLPPWPDTTTLIHIVTTTNVAQITNLVALTNVISVTNVVAATNFMPVTNIVALTNQISAPSVTTTRHISTTTNIASVTNVASLTNIAMIPNRAPFSGVASFTNVTAFTNVAVFTNIASVTNTASVTNLASHTRIASVTNLASVTSIAWLTNVASLTNVEITTTLVWATNLVSETNYVVITNTALASTSAPVATNIVLAIASTNALLSSNTPAKPSALGQLVESGQGFVTSRTNAFFYVEPKARRITAEQRAWLSNYVNRFEQALHGPGFRNPESGYAAFIEIDSFIDHHLLVEATKNIDGFRFSTFYSKDRGGKIKMEPIWDWNLSWGNARGRQGDQFEYWYWPQLDDRQYSWFRRLFEDPDFSQRYVDRWAVLRTNIFAIPNLVAQVDAFAAMLKEPAARNFERWPILGQVINTEPFAGKTYDEEILYLKGWLSNRLTWVSAQFVSAPSASPAEPSLALGTSLTLTSAAGKIYFTLDDSDPRLSGGAVSPTARLFDRALSVTNDLQIFARTQRENRWSSPLRTKISVAPTATAAKGK
jgi:hypothetical protein